MARIADVYRHPLLDGIVSRYEGFLTALPELLSKHIPRYMENESSDCVAGYPSRLALLRVPARRLWYYTQAFRRLAELYGDEHPDLDDCNDLVSRFDSVYRTTEAYALVAEFCQDYQLDAVERPNVHDRCRRRECSIAVLSSLVNEPHSRLIRVGFLEKMSSRGRGFQPRMALLFTDRLVYCGRVSGSTNMQLKRIKLTLITKKGISKSDRPSTEDKSQLISKARETQDMQSHVALNSKDNYLGLLGPRSHLQQTVLRCSGLAYVCWHRRLSVSLDNVLNANKCEISGYLLRKFKTSCGWQKLWTVFTDFTLFFYKSPEDSTPIASLPLLGYRLESARPAAAAADAQFHKSDVLQLTYKSHAYYFRTDAPVSFERYGN
ncbi:FERM, RhoGEF and pleckstrin domain-containing protein [Echinococcus granulosus]|uniref:FERM, RhoGEF and pleckstrin domain-containing protein n=1 Tax=Echinococcus granulosus TaxID=6210 RepID=W6VE47_ECHGR|nr:FERM, RhoGEF and pleckstrin domain-containing protein [Echinococcus granulosus]EUB65094.1 FERM, RhoGEF and pleckstrin domain-containing protein [Echinococcus granulosus]